MEWSDMIVGAPAVVELVRERDARLVIGGVEFIPGLLSLQVEGRTHLAVLTVEDPRYRVLPAAPYLTELRMMYKAQIPGLYFGVDPERGATYPDHFVHGGTRVKGCVGVPNQLMPRLVAQLQAVGVDWGGVRVPLRIREV